MEATDASRLVCVVVVSYQEYSLTHSQLAGLSAGPPNRVELIGAGSLGYGAGPSFG